MYAPNTDSERRVFFSSLDDFISEEYDNIIGGDFNCILNARLDKYGGNSACNSKKTKKNQLRIFSLLAL